MKEEGHAAEAIALPLHLAAACVGGLAAAIIGSALHADRLRPIYTQLDTTPLSTDSVDARSDSVVLNARGYLLRKRVLAARQH